MQNLIKEKLQIRKIRPKFMRQKATQKSRLSRSSYRAPKGLQSKMGDNKAGHRSQIKTGFGYPKALRGLDRKGRKIVMINNVADAQSVVAKDSIAVIASAIGKKKKIEIVKILMDKKVQMSNVKDAATYVTQVTSSHQQAREEKAKALAARAAKKESALKAKQGKKTEDAKASAKPAQADPEAVAAAKEAEKKEHDKILTQKQ